MNTLSLMDVVEAMENTRKEIRAARSNLKNRAQQKAITQAEYHKKRACTMLGLLNGKQYDIEGEPTGKIVATTALPIAKGICWKESLERDFADSEYKNVLVGLDSLKAELNSLQSIKKHLDEV